MKWPQFKRGRPWYSYDNGKTWTRKRRKPGPYAGHFVVTEVDPIAGTITVRHGFKKKRRSSG